MSKSFTDKPTLSKNLFPVVGIGASAGGLEAFKKLVKAIPPDSGIAYIMVQHMHPEHESLLTGILQLGTEVPVVEISNNIKVEPNHIYVIPSNKILTATDGILKLKPRKPGDKLVKPIDIFFSSLAEVHQAQSIGVVLSGTGNDGTEGLKDIKNHGGFTFAQTLDSAAYEGMPKNAIDSNIIDFILPPENIPLKLLELQQASITGVPGDDILKDKDAESFRQLITLLRIRSNVDFTFYKQTTVRRRIIRRMVMLQLNSLAEYLHHIKNNKTELDALFQDMLIPVTSFFRDPVTFEGLCANILPAIEKNASAASPLRVWVAGCSTGQEAYSIAICLHEHFGSAYYRKIQIFATDLSEKSISKARSGIYAKNEIDGVSESRLKEFFNKTDGSYQVKKQVRDMCIFAVQNFLKDPPFAKLDFISCRNVLIYFEPFLQKKAFTMFHYALNEKGILWLGKSETTGQASDLFMPFGANRFFSRKPGSGKFMSVASERNELDYSNKNHLLSNIKGKADDFQKAADDILLANAPAGVVLNNEFDIVQYRGSTSDFLEILPGKPSHNIFKMVKDDMAFELRNALLKVRNTNEPFIRKGILTGRGKERVSVEITPILTTIDLHYLILFRKDGEDSHTQQSAEINNHSSNGKDGQKEGVKDLKDERILQLEQQLAQAHEDMRSITEDQEATNEELQSSNEELLSGSEELQSLNEELETGKEELESTNEELMIVNQELNDRNDQLNQIRNFSEATIAMLHEPLLVLDKNFTIISANKSFYKIFHLTEEETLRKNVFELQDYAWEIPGLRKELEKIKKEKQKTIEIEIKYTFPGIGERIICFNIQPLQRENGEKLILLALDDITERKHISVLLKDQLLERKQGEINLRLILQSIPQVTITATAEGAVNFVNEYFLDYSGLTFEEATTGKGWKRILHPDELADIIKTAQHLMATGQDFYKELRLKRNSDEVYRWHIARATAIRNKENKIISWVGAASDIHEQKLKEQQKDEFIGIASHEMKTPLTTAKAYLQLLTETIDPGDESATLYAAKASSSVDRLHELVRDLLDVSKTQFGKLDYKITAFNFNGMVADTVESVQHSSVTHKILLKGKVSRRVTGDMERLQQVLINLLTNAIKYSPKAKKVFVNISEQSNEVTVSVKDSGIGISKTNLEKIFERYYRVEADAINFQGLGIGLYICHEIIQRHGGRIWGESEKGKGSTFYFSLPVKPQRKSIPKSNSTS